MGASSDDSEDQSESEGSAGSSRSVRGRSSIREDRFAGLLARLNPLDQDEAPNDERSNPEETVVERVEKYVGEKVPFFESEGRSNRQVNRSRDSPQAEDSSRSTTAKRPPEEGKHQGNHRRETHRSDRIPIPPGKPGKSSGRSYHPKLWLGIIFGVTLAVVIPGMVNVGHLEAALFAPDPASRIGDGDIVLLSAHDAAYLNRIYRETNHEVAYCGLLSNDEPPRIEIVMADSINAGPDFIEYTTDHCPERMQDVLLHTHPNGNIELSAVDERTLANRPEDLMCVQAGELPTEPKRSAENLACYLDTEPGSPGVDVRRIDVVITDSDSMFG